MKTYPIKTPRLFRALFPQYTWRVEGEKKKVYLTFDDGPHRGVTDRVLDILKAENVRATFFCVGYHAEENPELIQRINREGHSVGNHTYDHINGMKSSTERYMDSVVRSEPFIESSLFRPPYGRITPSQGKKLIQRGYQIIMWDILSGDFDPSNNPEKITQNSVRKTQPGSIIVLHDSKKAAPRMLPALTQIITQLKSKGFEFGVL
jgi:peptidoglycan/xylan/chitin deacetylase (PgdA/CDA1 family)